MKLSERIADTCFGLGYIYWDVLDDGQTSDDIRIDLTNGCEGKSAADALNAELIVRGYMGPLYGANVCNTKAKGIYIPQS